MSDFPITIYHNPQCDTSRNTLAMIRAAGYEPVVVEYLHAGWTKPQLKALLGQMGITAADALRVKGTPAEALGLTGPGMSEDAILDAMIKEPVLVNRPIVVTPRGVKLCRPSEAVLELLDKRPVSFTKEDGKSVKIQT